QRYLPPLKKAIIRALNLPPLKKGGRGGFLPMPPKSPARKARTLPFGLAILALNLPSTATAHGNFTLEEETTLNASVVAGYSHLDRDSEALWHVPGVLMGGEAHGPEAGFAVHEATLALFAGSDDGSFALLEAGAH